MDQRNSEQTSTEPVWWVGPKDDILTPSGRCRSACAPHPANGVLAPRYGSSGKAGRAQCSMKADFGDRPPFSCASHRLQSMAPQNTRPASGSKQSVPQNTRRVGVNRMPSKRSHTTQLTTVSRTASSPSRSCRVKPVAPSNMLIRVSSAPTEHIGPFVSLS